MDGLLLQPSRMMFTIRVVIQRLVSHPRLGSHPRLVIQRKVPWLVIHPRLVIQRMIKNGFLLMLMRALIFIWSKEEEEEDMGLFIQDLQATSSMTILTIILLKK